MAAAREAYQSKLDEVTARVRDRTRDLEALSSLRIWVAEFAALMLATRGMMDPLRAAWHTAIPHARASPPVRWHLDTRGRTDVGS